MTLTATQILEQFLNRIDQRARSLGMNRSQYIVQVLRQDLLTGKPNLSVLSEENDSPRYALRKSKHRKGKG